MGEGFFIVLAFTAIVVGGFFTLFGAPWGPPLMLGGIAMLLIAFVIIPWIVEFWQWASQVPITPWPNLNGVILSLAILVAVGLIVLLIVQFWPAIVAIGGVLLVIAGIILVIYLCVLLFSWLFQKPSAAAVIPVQLAYLGAIVPAF